MFYSIWAFRQLLSIFLPITYMYTGINRIPLQLPDKEQSGQRILTAKPKESVTKKQKIRNNAQSLLKETTRQKKKECFKQYFFYNFWKNLRKIIQCWRPWFVKTTLTLSFFFDPWLVFKLKAMPLRRPSIKNFLATDQCIELEFIFYDWLTSDPSKSEVWSKTQLQKEQAEVKTDSST